MTLTDNFTMWLAVLATVSYGCRITGFWLMRYLPRTQRLEAALRHAPVAVMLGIVVPGLARGHVPEFAGAAVVVASMFVLRSDLLAAIAGVGTVALVRFALSG